MKLTKTSGTAIAAAAAALIMAGVSVGTTTASFAEDKVQCYGVNACKGQAECKTASNECKGQNACKGQGFVNLTAAECTEKGGSTEPKS